MAVQKQKITVLLGVEKGKQENQIIKGSKVPNPRRTCSTAECPKKPKLSLSLETGKSNGEKQSTRLENDPTLVFRFSCLVLTADCIEPEVHPVTRKDSDTHTPRWTKTRQRGQQKSYRSPTHAGTDQKVVACKTEKGSGWEERTCRGSEDWAGSSHSRRSKRAVNNHGKKPHLFVRFFHFPVGCSFRIFRFAFLKFVGTTWRPEPPFCSVVAPSVPATSGRSPVARSAVCHSCWWLFMKLPQQDSSQQLSCCLASWLCSQRACTAGVCMADKEPLTAKWIIAPRTL